MITNGLLGHSLFPAEKIKQPQADGLMLVDGVILGASGNAFRDAARTSVATAIQ